MTTELRVTLPPLHRGQLEIVRHPARFKVAACGRRYGKTRLGAFLAIEAALAGQVAWWVAPSFPLASIGWRAIRRLCRQIPEVEIREVDRMAVMPSGGWVQVRSADNPDSLRGEGLDLVVFDEAAFAVEEAWTDALRPALSDRHGRAVFLSTPNGSNWFARLFGRGQDPLEEEWQSWNQPSWANPYLDAAEIEQARADMPEDTFRQEYGAEFRDSVGQYFSHVDDAIAETPVPLSGATVAGADWGDRDDYTVFTPMVGGHIPEITRLNRSGWEYQFEALAAFCGRWLPRTLLIEANSIGGPMLERCQRDLPQRFPGLTIQGFYTTNQSKRELMAAFKLGMETHVLSFASDPVLLSELRAFRYTVTPAGAVTLSAPRGGHDDTVISAALAWWAESRLGTVGDFRGATDALERARERLGERRHQDDDQRNRPLVRTLEW